MIRVELQPEAKKYIIQNNQLCREKHIKVSTELPVPFWSDKMFIFS